MSRKNWSNLLILLAAVNLALAVTPGNRWKLLHWMALPVCLMLSAKIRRRMI